MIIPFATQSYKSLSLPVSAQRCVNAYAEKEPPDAKTQVAVFQTPGLLPFATCGIGPVRGMHVLNNTLYVVSGQTLYSVSSAGAATPLGSAVTGNNVVQMADNGTQLCIVNGTNGYIWSPTTGFTVISDPNFHAANTVTFFDNFFMFDWAGTNKFFISNTLDGTTYNGLAFAAKETQSDFVVSLVNQQETLLVFGQRETEVWYDAGQLIFPFLRVSGAVIERGCAAAQTPIKEDNSVFFLGDDLVFYRLNQLMPLRVSTHAIEQTWRTYTTVSDAFCFSATHAGHKFIYITFPTANATWGYDIATGLWHERNSWDMFNNPYGRWRANCKAACYNLNLIGDAFSGQIGSWDINTITEFGNTVQTLYTSAHIHNDRKRMFISRLELDFDVGVGLPSGQGSNPQVMLQFSRDGGHTYGPIQQWNSLGPVGAYKQRLRWLKCGQGRDIIVQATISDPVRRTLVNAHADISVGM